MRTRVPSAPPVLSKRDQPVHGLPQVNYYLPMVVTLLATLFLVLVVGFLTLIAFGNTLAQFGRPSGADSSGDGSSIVGLVCGLLGLVGVGGTIYFLVAAVKGVRDLLSPIYYTRGNVADKGVIAGRLAGNWLGVLVTYAGPDQAVASEVTDDQLAASPDRSQIFQPRLAPQGAISSKGGYSYLPADRISGSGSGSSSRSAPASRARLERDLKRQSRMDRIDALAARSQASFREEAEDPAKRHRVVFRVEAAPFATLQSGDEILLAHSRYLEHVYYVAHLKGGEWESFVNRALI